VRDQGGAQRGLSQKANSDPWNRLMVSERPDRLAPAVPVQNLASRDGKLISRLSLAPSCGNRWGGKLSIPRWVMPNSLSVSSRVWAKVIALNPTSDQIWWRLLACSQVETPPWRPLRTNDRT
jgi:hypothetical protein